MIPHNKPCITKKDAKNAYETISSEWIAYGNKSTEIEKKLSEYILGCKENKSVMCSSGTSALYLGLFALDIQRGDEIIMPTYTCTAVLNAVKQIGANPILVDININNLNIDIEIVKNDITKKTKAIIVTHTYGIPCEIDNLKTLGIPIIEDCSQALGTKFKDGSLTGSKGDISIFSFYATKMITGGYGGAVLSNNEKYIKRIREFINFD